MPLPNHPAVVNALDHLRNSGSSGLRASLLVELLDTVQPNPAAIVVLRALVDAGYVRASVLPVTTESILVLTEDGRAELAAAESAGAWICRGGVITPNVLTEPSIMAFLRSVELGEVTLTPSVNPDQVYAGVVPYSASNGWRVAIFNDCNEWDYIEWVEVEGERVCYEEIERRMPEVNKYEPSAEIAEVAYKIPRVTRRRRGSEALDADERAFVQLREVLDGKRRIQLDDSSSETLRIMLGGGDTDTEVTAERFVVRFGPQRRPCSYFRRLSPRVVSELLERAALDTVATPIVIGLPANTIPKTGAFPEWSYEAKLVWIVADADSVKVLVRKLSEKCETPFVKDIPAGGPLALPRLPEWAPGVRERAVYREFAAELECEICGTPGARYREIRGGLVCLACGRSFDYRGG